MFFMPSLDTRYSCCKRPRPLVNTSASCSVVAKCWMKTIPLWIFSLTKWQSMSMCLVLSWKTGLQAIWMAAVLSLCITCKTRHIQFTKKINYSYNFSNSKSHASVFCFFGTLWVMSELEFLSSVFTLEDK